MTTVTIGVNHEDGQIEAKPLRAKEKVGKEGESTDY